MEVWLHAFSFPHRVAETAQRAEAWGFDGLLLADSQNLTADIWVELALAGAVTSRLRLGPGVTNPVTRHVAVTASAAATLQLETGGRAVVGFARGDSALSQIGREPVGVDDFERDLARLQGFLAGDEVDLDGTPSAIRWLAGGAVPKVPVWVAATGPRTIAAGGKHAEGVDLTVGAEPERLRWAAGVAREAGRPGVTLGAYVNVGVHPDRAAARDLVRGSTAIFARFAAEGAPESGLSEVTREGIEHLAAGYERRRHGEAAAPAARRLEDGFIDRFAVAGPADEVAARLAALAADLRLDRLVVVPGSVDTDPAELERSNARFAAEVLPALGRGPA